MSSAMRRLAIAAAVLASSGTSARAQMGDFGWGQEYPSVYAPPIFESNYWFNSTPIEGILRGQGAFMNGWGNLCLRQAQAGAIENRMWIEWNEYVYRCLLERESQRQSRVAAKRQSGKELSNDRRNRIRYNPTNSDINNGDTLNVLLDELMRSVVSLRALNGANVPIPCKIVRALPIRLASEGVRKPMTLDDLITKRVAVSRTFQREVIDADPDGFHAYLRHLRSNDTTSVPALIDFMHRFGLKFHVAETAPSKSAHRVLHGRLLALSETVAMIAEARETNRQLAN